jgi:hypothetical protein
MTDFREGECFLQAIVDANADGEGLATGPARVLETEIGQAATSGITKIVECTRCASGFKVYNDGAVFLRGETTPDCSDTVRELRSTSDHVQIDLSKFLAPILW